MNFQPILLMASLVMGLSACATSPKVASNFEENRESVSVVLMEPKVEVMFDKVGSKDLRVDWTKEAEANLKSAIISHLKSTGETVTEFQTASISQDQLDQLLALNEQVNTAMGQHVVNIGNTPFLGPLPHKKDRKKELNYSLGQAMSPIKRSTNADYAAFLTYRAVIESGGSILTKIAIGTVTGYVPAGTDFRGTLVNLVDLNTGEVVWLNSDLGGSLFSGDARKLENATKTINKIMDEGPFVESKE